MIDKKETFSFTFLFNDDNDKVILIKQGDCPVKELEEADQVLQSGNSEEDDAAIDGIISKIPVFEAAEAGSEVMITETLGDLEDKYGISIEQLEEETGQDLNNEQKEDAPESHLEKILKQHEEDMFEKEKEVDGECSLEILTDPTAIMPEHRSQYTSPESFLEEDDGYEDMFTPPELITEAEELLEEGITPEEAIKSFVANTESGKLYYSNDILALFSKLTVFDREAQEVILNRLPAGGNIIFIRDNNGVPCMKRSTGGNAPAEGVKVDHQLISEVLNGNRNTPQIDSGVQRAAKQMQRPAFLRHQTA